MRHFGLLCIDASMGGWMGRWMDTRPILFLQMEMMKMHESIPILGDGKWMKMAEWQWKRMTYNILGVSMLCQLACQFLSQVVTSKGIYPINTIGESIDKQMRHIRPYMHDQTKGSTGDSRHFNHGQHHRNDRNWALPAVSSPKSDTGLVGISVGTWEVWNKNVMIQRLTSLLRQRIW